MKTNKCKKCRRVMTWAETRVQFGRLLKKSVSEELAKKLMPMCQKCTTVHCDVFMRGYSSGYICSTLGAQMNEVEIAIKALGIRASAVTISRRYDPKHIPAIEAEIKRAGGIFPYRKKV